jgi:hypothetical protein
VLYERLCSSCYSRELEKAYQIYSMDLRKTAGISNR